MAEYDKTRAAAAQADAETGFYIHLAVYVLVIALLVGINYREGDGWWAQWPAMGWGIGIIGHALGVFGRVPNFLAQRRLRRIERLRSQMR
ncbi:unnamed protein product [Phaeothamnion confervicola]